MPHSAMTDDLAFAKAAVDWADSNLPPFESRLQTWLRENVYTTTKELPSNPTHDAVVMRAKVSLPLLFSAEVGAYINSVRSALDVPSIRLQAATISSK
jgi:hypothetical protein